MTNRVTAFRGGWVKVSEHGAVQVGCLSRCSSAWISRRRRFPFTRLIRGPEYGGKEVSITLETDVRMNSRPSSQLAWTRSATLWAIENDYKANKHLSTHVVCCDVLGQVMHTVRVQIVGKHCTSLPSSWYCKRSDSGKYICNHIFWLE